MDEFIFRKLGRTSRIAHRYMGNRLESQGLSKGQPRILHLLQHHQYLTQKDLLSRMDIRPATLTRMLQRMEKNGLITRAPSKKDQRIMEISLTEKGKEAQKKAKQVLHELEAEISALMTEEEIETLCRIFDKLYTHIREKEKGGQK